MLSQTGAGLPDASLALGIWSERRPPVVPLNVGLHGMRSAIRQLDQVQLRVSEEMTFAGNGIFAAGDRRPKTCLRDEAYAQRRKSRPHDREKPAENRPFRRLVFHGE